MTVAYQMSYRRAVSHMMPRHVSDDEPGLANHFRRFERNALHRERGTGQRNKID